MLPHSRRQSLCRQRAFDKISRTQNAIDSTDRFSTDTDRTFSIPSSIISNMAEAEKALIEKVELRIALANNDTKFESALKVYLAPLLLKFASPQQQVRTQISKTVSYLITRINSAKNVKLPVDALINQVKNPTVPKGADPTTVQTYTLLFVSKGISRLSEDEQKLLIPKIINGISSTSSLIGARLFSILCKLLVSFKFPIKSKADEKAYREFLGLEKDDEDNKDEDFLIEKFYKFMIMIPVQANEQGVIPKGISLPGLSKDDVAFFTHNAGVTFDSPTLTSYKRSILKFIEYGFNEKKSNIVLIVSSADSATEISELGTSILKRRSIDHEDPFIVDTLLSLFVGDLSNGRPPAKVQLQEKLMNFFTQSKRAALSSELGKLSSIGLNSEFKKLKQTTVRFIKWVTTIMTDESVQFQDDLSVNMAAQLKASLQTEKALDVTGNFNSYLLQRRYEYEALGLILRKSPKLDGLLYLA
ncbi:unnamed protein product [Ambrosiozyma monospora]|uniref:Unnamed protein product n=1 Tax=Ambrosiozyma monospora TaxID=43982 RepID=A0ACB5T699_AMBMO|nr:unnamed protein product [Ambrosiozyma monospora]